MNSAEFADPFYAALALPSACGLSFSCPLLHFVGWWRKKRASLQWIFLIIPDFPEHERFSVAGQTEKTLTPCRRLQSKSAERPEPPDSSVETGKRMAEMTFGAPDVGAGVPSDAQFLHKMQHFGVQTLFFLPGIGQRYGRHAAVLQPRHDAVCSVDQTVDAVGSHATGDGRIIA